MLKYYKQKGFSLIETFVVVGTITFLAVGVFTTVNKQVNKAQTSNLSKSLEQLDKNIRNAFVTIGDTSTLNNNMLAMNGLLPKDMSYIAANNAIMTSVGANINVGQSVLGTKSYSVSTQVPKVNCSELLSDKIIADSINIFINDIPVKQNGTLVADPLSTITTSCQRDLNTVEFNNIIQVTGSIPNALGNPNPLRNQDTSAMISSPTNLDINAGAASCPAGTTADVFQGCTCPAQTRWNGFSCSDISSIRNNCGQGFKRDYGSGICIVANPVNIEKTVSLDPASLAVRFAINDANIAAGLNPNIAATSGIFAYNNAQTTTNVTAGGVINPSISAINSTLNLGLAKSVSTTSSTDTTYDTTISKMIPNQYGFSPSTNYTNAEVIAQCAAVGGNFMGQSCQVCMANSVWDGSRCARVPG